MLLILAMPFSIPLLKRNICRSAELVSDFAGAVHRVARLEAYRIECGMETRKAKSSFQLLGGQRLDGRNAYILVVVVLE